MFYQVRDSFLLILGSGEKLRSSEHRRALWKAIAAIVDL